MSSNVVRAAEPDFLQVEQQFRNLPMEARRQTGPLFWLHGDESRERLEMYVGKVAEGGNGCFTAESRPHVDWLGPAWYRDLAICLVAAKKHDLKLWIFDEKWWPSGEVAGRLPQRYGSKRLMVTVAEAPGGSPLVAAGYGGPRFVAAIAGRDTPEGIDGASLIDLAPFLHEDKLSWTAPAGKWKVFKFTWENRLSTGRYILDGASQDCVDWYIQTVYQPHYDHFAEEFGRTIVGFFYDEPVTQGDWGTEVMKVLAERKVDWKKALMAWKFRLAGEEQTAARYQYRDALAEAWGRTLYGGLARWCQAHHVISQGHFLEHGNCYLNPELCAGNMFQLQKYSDRGAIDAVFDQFVWGKRVTRDAPVWQTPKLGSSISHAYGKAEDVTMVEIFGARGQDVTYPEMKWWADHMQVSGVNFLIPHSFNPRAPRDTDCPPYFYNGGFEPRWPLYRVFADYTSRLSVMLSGGRHICPVALLFLGQSVHEGKAQPPEQISEALQDALYDCDWIPYDVFQNDLQVSGRELRLRDERYRVLLVPPAEVMPYEALRKVREFFDHGGVVVGHGFLPSKSATLGRGAKDIAKLREAVWGDPQPGLAVCKTSAAGGRSYLLPLKPTPEQLEQILAADAGVRPTLEVLRGRTDHWLHVLHRVKSGHDVFFITNQNHLGAARHFRFRVTAAGVPECWDAMRNEITAVPFDRRGKQVELELTLEPSESVLLVFQQETRSLPRRLGAAAAKPAISIPIDGETLPATDPKLDVAEQLRSFGGCSWIWCPEGGPVAKAPPGIRYFRRNWDLPADCRIKKATFTGLADDRMTLFINGKNAGQIDHNQSGFEPVSIDVTSLLQPGQNRLAMEAVNAPPSPSPAGIVGRLAVETTGGTVLELKLDSTWKSTKKMLPDWATAGFSDAAWVAAKEVAPFGGGPWGNFGGARLTLSPVKASPYAGHTTIPDSVSLNRSRVYLELDGLAPEESLRATINGHDAGGVIGRPLRLDVTRFVKPGVNAIRLDPFSPKAARLVIYTLRGQECPVIK